MSNIHVFDQNKIFDFFSIDFSVPKYWFRGIEGNFEAIL